MWVRERSQMSCYYGGNNDDNELRRDEGGRKMKTHSLNMPLNEV